MRLGLTGAALGLSLVLAIWGGVLVEFLYDDRYTLAGSIVVVVAIVLMIQLIPVTYDQAALAAGDSGRFFVMVALRAGIQIAAFVIGVELFGLVGAFAGQAVGLALSYVVVVVLIRPYGVWDPLHDAVAWGAGLAVALLALGLNRDLLEALIAVSA